MLSHPALLTDLENIYRAAQDSEDGQRCAVAPHPDLRARMIEAMRSISAAPGFNRAFSIKFAEPRALGLNDGTIYPPERFQVGAAPSAIQNTAATRPPLRGVLKVIVVLANFSDQPMNATQA